LTFGALTMNAASQLTAQGSGAGTGTSITAGGTTTLGTNSTFNVASTPRLNLAGQVTGTGDLVKTGDGALTLSNATNNYTGTTTIRRGQLIAAGNAPSGAAGVLGNAVTPIGIGGNSDEGIPLQT